MECSVYHQHSVVIWTKHIPYEMFVCVCVRRDAGNITTLWNVLRIINILIMVRLLKIIPHFKVRLHCLSSASHTNLLKVPRVVLGLFMSLEVL